MSPVGGVGVNLAVQDAVATANILAQALKERRVTAELLAAVETRRSLPMRVIQRLQVFVHNRVLTRVLASRGRIAPPWPVKLLNRFPLLRRLPAYIIGIGVRPEHIRTSASAP
jgi:2-polyprenyl-6-methoxyphenol hydroxylase-like FAD-dependent oxidoreductase